MECCNVSIHNGLIDVGEICCPFCGTKLQDYESKQDNSCCDNKEIIKDEGMNVCQNCGSVYGYEVAREYVDFYENMHRFRRKSIYHRKYHIRNKIIDIRVKHKLRISISDTQKIYLIFEEIDKILSQVKRGRKRMISIDYILRQLFRMLRLPYKDLRITKSKRTLAFYEQYWDGIDSLIGDKIQSIIHK